MNIKNKLSTGQYMIDQETKQITFLDQRFYALEDNVYVPSASTILNAYPKPASFYEWLKANGDDADNIRDEAARAGSVVHSYTEKYDNGEAVSLFNSEGTINCKSGDWKMFERYVEFSNKHNPVIVMNEESFASKELGYGGTLDRVIRFNDQNLLIDIKTSNQIHNHYWLQMASYVELLKQFHPDLHIDNIAILWLNAKTRTEGKNGAIQGKGWQLVFPDKPIEYYWKLFLHTQALWNEENAGMKPNLLTYKLEHKK